MRTKEASMGFMNVIRGVLNNQCKPKPCNHLFNGLGVGKLEWCELCGALKGIAGITLPKSRYKKCVK